MHPVSRRQSGTLQVHRLVRRLPAVAAALHPAERARPGAPGVGLGAAGNFFGSGEGSHIVPFAAIDHDSQFGYDLSMAEVTEQLRKLLYQAIKEGQRNEDIAKAAGIHPVNLRQFKAEIRSLPLKKLESLAKALGAQITVVKRATRR